MQVMSLFCSTSAEMLWKTACPTENHVQLPECKSAFIHLGTSSHSFASTAAWKNIYTLNESISYSFFLLIQNHIILLLKK